MSKLTGPIKVSPSGVPTGVSDPSELIVNVEMLLSFFVGGVQVRSGRVNGQPERVVSSQGNRRSSQHALTHGKCFDPTLRFLSRYIQEIPRGRQSHVHGR